MIGLSLSFNDLEITGQIGQLTSLQRLTAIECGLSSLPDEFASLSKLQYLDLDGNKFNTLPAPLCSVTSLQVLDMQRNDIDNIPPDIEKLVNLRDLNLSWNRLTDIQLPISRLIKLRTLAIGGNPLPPEVLKLSGGRSGKGTKLLKYLRALKSTPGGKALRRFDEAKVLLLGAGEVGKTWLLQALQGKVPEDVGSTKGIEIVRQPLDLMHPHDEKRTLHLNCWDFGGQDHYQITHQIFFSSKAVYLLIWKPRPGVDPDLIQRLERIQLGAGRTAKVLIVSTHADGNVPAIIGTEALRERFGELIGGFFEVDSKAGPEGTGIAVLQQAIANAVAQLEGMELEYPTAWHRAREALLSTTQKTIRFRDFVRLCQKHGMDASFAGPFAEILEVHGKAVYFPEAATDNDIGLDGDNLIVLDPEWLAKAVGFVIEDRPTIEKSGILEHERLHEIWAKRGDCPGYDSSLYGYLLWLMWKFDIAYRQDQRTSLVPQLIMRNRPDDLYWTPHKAAPAGVREATLICRLPHDPPLGLIPTLTAAVHPLRQFRRPDSADNLDRNWRQGFFLDTARRGEAFVELLDRDLRIVVRDDYPANLIDKVRETLDEIVAARWPKLEIDFRVPCTGTQKQRRCSGSHRRSWLESQRGKVLHCENCGSVSLSPEEMLDGFDVREAEILAQLRELNLGQKELAAGQMHLLASAHAIFQAIDPENEEHSRAPNMFTIIPDKGKWFENATHDFVRVSCWCEHPDGPHPVTTIGSGTPPDYLLKMPRKWLLRAAPYISWAATLFKAFSPLAGNLITTVEPDVEAAKYVTAMNDAAKAIPTGSLEVGEREELPDLHRYRPEFIALRHLHDYLLDPIKPNDRWGDLRPVQTKSGQLLWLCQAHAAIQQPPVEQI